MPGLTGLACQDAFLGVGLKYGGNGQDLSWPLLDAEATNPCTERLRSWVPDRTTEADTCGHVVVVNHAIIA